MIFAPGRRAVPEFIATILQGGAARRHAGGNQYFPVDHDEYVQILRGTRAAPWRYEVRITEELRGSLTWTRSG